MTYNDLRRGRVSTVGQVYLLTTVTARRETFFRDLYLARIVVAALRERDQAGDTDTLAFVVMPDHLHWLVELASRTRLESVMKRVKGVTAQQINAYLARTGAVWQPSYHDHALRRDECLADVARYVLMNPVRAGLIDSIRDYPHWDSVWSASDIGLPG